MTMKRKILILTLILLVLACPAVWLNVRRGVSVGDVMLYEKERGALYKNRENSVSLQRMPDSTAFDIRLKSESLTVRLVWQGDQATFTFDDGTVISGIWTGAYLRDEEGLPISLRDGITITFNGQETTIGKNALCEDLCRMDRSLSEPYGHIGLVLAGALLYTLGAATLLFPEEMHFFGSRWKYAHAELSDDGRMMQQLGGVVGMLCSIVIMYLPAMIR